MNKTEEDRILALAGIFQAAYSVDQIARNGVIDSQELQTAVFSILQTDAEDIPAVFEHRGHLKSGLKTLLSQMLENKTSKVDITRYALQLMHLAAKLQKSPEALQNLSRGIDIAKGRAETFGMTHINLLSQLADLYVENISNLSSRIMVNGEPVHLNNPDNVSRIRAILLAGVRAAWLWLQCGGRRRQMIFSRKKIYRHASEMLEKIKAAED